MCDDLGDRDERAAQCLGALFFEHPAEPVLGIPGD